MKKPVKQLVILGIVFIGASLVAQLSPANSSASTLLHNPIRTITALDPPAMNAAGGGFTLYLPLVFKPPPPLYLPLVAKPAPTPTPTPTSIPNPIVNGGFEQQGTGWYAALQQPWNGTPQGVVLATSRDSLPSPVTPHSGDWVTWLGGYLNSTTTLETANPFTVPAGGSTLRYWIWIQSDEGTCSVDYDFAWVYFITDQQHQVDAYTLCTPNVTNGWVNRNIDLSGYVGQSGYLDFSVRILGNNSNLFIDDVSMGTLTSAPLRNRTPVPTR